MADIKTSPKAADGQADSKNKLPETPQVDDHNSADGDLITNSKFYLIDIFKLYL
jgi:hypothetical protein